ncbi:hypothetical protein ACVWXN_000444 [Bradyrhizobium sp. i1.4.4]
MGSRSPHRPLAWRRSQLRNYRSWRRPGSRSGALAATRRPGAGRVENAPALLGDAARRIEPENKSRILALPGDNDGDTLRSLATCARRSSTKRPGAPDALITAVRPMLATNTRGQLVYLSTPKGKLRNLALQRCRLAPHPSRVGLLPSHHSGIPGPRAQEPRRDEVSRRVPVRNHPELPVIYATGFSAVCYRSPTIRSRS